MDDQHVPIGPVEPGEDQQLVADLDAPQRIEDLRLKADPRIGRSLVTLLGSGIRVSQRRLDTADFSEVECQG
jgi:hypothetical protein